MLRSIWKVLLTLLWALVIIQGLVVAVVMPYALWCGYRASGLPLWIQFAAAVTLVAVYAYIVVRSLQSSGYEWRHPGGLERAAAQGTRIESAWSGSKVTVAARRRVGLRSRDMPLRRHCSPRLMQRLAGREERASDRALAEIADGLPADEARELVDLIDVELGLPIGLLRPDDSLRKLLAPFPMGNPLTWPFAEGALEDGTSEIQYQLRLRREQRGWAAVERVETVRDLFVAWCRP